MKIHVVRIQNINSLVVTGDKPHVVDLDKDLGHSPLFLIRGPTGAGKSTILDAITLALFGRTARLDDDTARAVKNDEDIRESDARRVLSHGTGRGYAEVDFSTIVSGHRCFFRARWTARRAHDKADGTMQPPTRTLWRLAGLGAPAEDAVALCDSSRKADIDGAFGPVLHKMAFEDFVRSVLLAQGDFQAFLKADKKSRSDMLARLTDATAFKNLGLEAGRRYNASKRRLAAIEAVAQATTFLDPAQLEELRAELVALGEAAAGLGHEEQQLTSRVQRAEALLSAAKADDEAGAAALQARKDLEDLSELRVRVARAEQAATLMAPITYATTRAEESSAAARRVAALEAALPQFQATKVLSAQQADAAAETLVQLRGEFERLRPLIGEASRATEAWHRAIATSERQAVVRDARQHASAQAVNASAAAQEAHLAAVAAVTRAKEVLAKLPDRATQEAHVVRVREGWIELNAANQRVNAAADRLKTLDQSCAVASSQTAHATEALAESQARLAELSQQHTAATSAVGGLTGGEAPDAARRRLEGTRTASEAAGANCQRAVTLLLQQNSVGARAEAAKAVVAGAAAEIERETGAIHGYDVRVAALLAELEELELNARALDRVLVIANQRDLLRPDAACPLCGSHTHPWVDGAADAPAPDSNRALFDANATAIATARVARQTAEAARVAALKRQEQAKLASAKAEGELRPLEDEGARIEVELATLLTALGLPRSVTAVELDARRELHRSNHGSQVKALDALSRAVDALRAAEALHDRGQQAVATAQIVLANARERLQSCEHDRLSATADLAEARAAAAAATAALVVTCRGAGEPTPEDTSLDEFSLIGKRLRSVVEAIDAAQKVSDDAARDEAALLLTLSRAEAEAKAAVAEADRSAAEAEAAVAQAASLDAARSEALGHLGGADPARLEAAWVERLDAAATALEGARTAQHAAAKALGEAESGLSHHRAQRELAAAAAAAAEQRVAEAFAAVDGWSDAAEVKAAVMPAADLKVASEMIAAAKTGLVSAEATKANTAGRFVAAMAEATGVGIFDGGPPQPDTLLAVVGSAIANAEARRRSVRDELAALHQSRGALANKLAEDDRARAAHATRLTKLAEARAEYAHWERIYAIIGTREGDAFVTLAQGYHLEALAVRANARLRLLSRRYSLAVKKDEAGAPTLDFLVLDEEQARTARPPSTLSGGETFVVSLALALALSDFRAMDQPIETVLIDEGFGTLDTETLSTVIATLESLHATSGSQIGLISHVAMLAERIPTRVYVKPIGQGRSELVIES